MSARLLVVDDNENNLESVKDILEDAGYEVHTAASLKTGLDVYSRDSFALAIIDLQLPDGSGLQLAQEIKSKQPLLQIILMTGHAEGAEPAGLHARQEGLVDQYLVKPVNPPQLLKIIAHCLAS